MDTLEMLMNARAEVAKGWCKGIDEDRDGNVCALGAVWRVTGERYTPRHIMPLYHVLHDEGYSVVSWNDHPDTTKADVLALYDRAIAAEAVKASPDPAHVHAVA